MHAQADRESIEDRKVTLFDKILDVPKASLLCDGMNIEKMLVDIGDAKLYCEREGKGRPPIVLINGGPGATHHDFHPYFSRAAEYAEVIYYDQRGCGLSEYAEGAGYSVEQAVDDLEKMREALKIEKWVILGHSYGGTVSRRYTEKYPNRVSGLVLVGAAFDGLSINEELIATRVCDYLTRHETKRIDEVTRCCGSSMERTVFNRLRNGDWKRLGYYKPSEDEMARAALFGWEHDGEKYRGAIRFSLKKLNDTGVKFSGLPGIKTLILEGKLDLIWGEEKPEKLAKCFKDADLVVFEKAGHCSFRDTPDNFFNALKNFILSLDSPQSRRSAKRQVAIGFDRAPT